MSIRGSAPRTRNGADGRKPRWPPVAATRIGATFAPFGQERLRGGQGPERRTGQDTGPSAISRAVVRPGDERTFAGALC
mgnify:CR=1 FL=1